MKKVKLLSLFLAVLMLCGTVTLFASCGGVQEGILELSEKVIDVDVTDYTVVYGETQGSNNYTATFKEQMQLFAKKLSEATGLKFSANEFKRTRSKAEDKEILIGATEREESKKALSKIDGDGFIVEVTDNKIVIVGTSNLFTLMGVTYFTERYLGGEGNATLSVIETMAANEVGVITLADSTMKNKDSMKDASVYVYQSGLGTLPGAYAKLSTTNTPDQEYPLEAISQIQEKLSNVSGVQNKLFSEMTRSDAETAEKEILVGLTAREESKQALADITTSEFIIAATDKKVVLNAWSEATLKLATKAYIDLMSEGYKEVDGKKIVEIPQNFRLIGRTTAEWITDFPKPEGDNISLYNTQDANDGGLQYLYTGEGVNRAAYDAYCKTLLSQGFKLYSENEVEGSVFKTFTSAAKDMSLYVAYNAYTHKDEYDSYDWTIIKKIDEKALGEVYDYDPCIRLVATPLKTSYLPEAKLLKKQTYEKVTDSRVTTMPLYSGAVGLSYIVTLEDGSFIVFDGGNVAQGGIEHDILWNTLVALHKEIYGAEPTTTNPVHIAAWVLTHVHGDHYNAFSQLGKKYGSTGLLKMDYMIANTPSADSCYLWTEETTKMSPDRINSLQNCFKGGFTYIKVMTGQKFYLANVEIEVLTTWMDLNPITPANGNNTNTVLRFTLSNKESSNKVTQVWTGDANRWQSRFLCATYGDYLKSDMVNIAHHGNAGCEVEFYDKVSPTAVWWPHNATAAQNYIGSSASTGYMYEVDQHIYNDIASVKYVYTSGAKKVGGGLTSMDDGPFTTLVITKDGPDYDNIYNLMKGNYGDKDAKLDYFIYTDGSMIEACTKK